MKAQIIKYGCCGKIFAACLEPECYTDKDWQKDLRTYVKKGCVVDTVESGDLRFRFGKCTCNEEAKKEVAEISDPNQIALFQ